MGTFIAFLLFFILVAIFGPRFVPDGKGWSKFAKYTTRFVALGCLLFTALATSFASISDNKTGHLFKVYGKDSLKEGAIIAVNGETGPQAEILMPGFNFRLLLNIIYNVNEQNVEIVKEGFYGFLLAKDGAPLRTDQTFADALSSLKTANGEKIDAYRMLIDAKYFLANGGQKGPQTTVLTPGTHRINRHLWNVEQQEATDIPKGFVGVIKSNVHSAVDFGNLKSERPNECALKSTRKSEELDVPLVTIGCIGIWDTALNQGLYYINRKAFDVTLIPIRVQAWQYMGGYVSNKIDLTYDQAGTITQVKSHEDVAVPKDAADSAISVKVEGWTIKQNARVLLQVRPGLAPFVVASTGGLKEIEDRIITPAFQSVLRNIAGSSLFAPTPVLDADGNPVIDKETGSVKMKAVSRLTRALDFIENRTLIEEQVEPLIKHEGKKAGIDIMEVRLLHPDFPPELLVARKREQLAEQLRRAYAQEQIAQTARIETENKSATANQQAKLVEAEIEFERSVRIAKAKREEGRGERDKLNLIAEGQKAQASVLGEERVVELRKFELVLDRVVGFAEKNPQVLSDVLSNASKFVPERLFLFGGDNGGNNLSSAMGILGDMLGGDTKKKDLAPEKTKSQ